jgi:hypothetical protein
METAVDVVSLSGKLATLDESHLLERLAGNISELVKLKSGRVTRNTSWSLANCNALNKIKTLEGLIVATDKLNSHRNHVLTSMKSVICRVLRGDFWSDEDAQLSSSAGLLPRIVVSTMDGYFHLLLHLRTISTSAEAFKGVVLLQLRYHVDQFMQICRYALARSVKILKNYVYMRDAVHANFLTVN